MGQGDWKAMSSNPCGHDIEPWLHKKADGRLSPEEAAALLRQVGTCSACRERAELLEWAGNALRQGRRAVPVGFSDKVMRRVAVLRVPKPTLPEPPRVPVELQLAGASARTVAVVGDFNGWDAATMKKGDDG